MSKCECGTCLPGDSADRFIYRFIYCCSIKSIHSFLLVLESNCGQMCTFWSIVRQQKITNFVWELDLWQVHNPSSSSDRSSTQWMSMAESCTSLLNILWCKYYSTIHKIWHTVSLYISLAVHQILCNFLHSGHCNWHSSICKHPLQLQSWNLVGLHYICSIS